MKNKVTRNAVKPVARRFSSRLSLLLMATLSQLSFQSEAQTSRTYSQPAYNFKNYSINKEGTGGTIYNAPGANSSVHYMWLSPHGDMQNSVYYDNRAGEDDRFVDINSLGNGDQLITSATYDPVAKKHFIRLINTRADGTFIQAVDLKKNTVGNYDMYPMSTLVDRDMIYICGYIRDPQGGVSDYHTGKTAFVLSYEPATQTVTATYFGFASSYIFYTYGGDKNEYYDFNMALRMKMLDIPNVGKYLMVTGSTFAFHPVPPPVPSMNTAVGATLLAMFDPTTMLSNYHTSFAASGASVNSDLYEYGMGIHYDGASKIYVMGNYAHAFNRSEGFDTHPTQPWIQAVDFPYLTPSAGGTAFDRTVFRTDAAWGLQMEEDQSNPGSLVIAGLQMKPVGLCQYPLSAAPNGDNINPFLLNISTSYSSAINVTQTDWTTLPSIIGTGAGPDSYLLLGGGDNTMAWAPNQMAQDGSVPYKIMAPISDKTGSSLLNSKFIAADNSRQIMDCQNASSPCSTPMTGDYAVLSDASSSYFFHDMFDVDISPAYLREIPLSITELRCDDRQHRPAAAGNTVLAQAVTPSIYPNPASSFISLSPATYVTGDKAEIRLIDITGKVMGLLFNGDAKAIPEQLTLPTVANGIYLVDISINGNNTRKEKISILH